MDHVPPSSEIIVSAKAHVSAARLGLTGEQLMELLPYAHRISRYKDGLRLWSVKGGYVSVHEVLSLDGTGRLVKATVTDAFTDVDERWQERTPGVPVARKRHKSGPHYLRRAS